MHSPTATASLPTPLGVVRITADDANLLGLRLPRELAGQDKIALPDHPLLRAACEQLAAWFAGELQVFDLPLAPVSSAEGEALRAAIAAIPFGETLTYGALAAQIGSVARAVGQACKTNTFPIVIPCHRVVSSTGPEYYSGGAGPRTKTWLLDFEYDHLPPERRTRLI